MRTLNLRDVVEMVERTIEGHEDYKYSDEELYVRMKYCVNVLYDMDDYDSDDAFEAGNRKGKSNFRPGCLIGTLLINEKIVDMDWFFDTETNGSSFFGLKDDIEEDKGIYFTPIASTFLSRAQGSQDEGFSWADSYWKAWEGTLNYWMSMYGKMRRDELIQEDTEYIQSLFGQFRPKEENAVSS